MKMKLLRVDLDRCQNFFIVSGGSMFLKMEGLVNSHPYLSAALLGASIRLEEDVAAGRLDSSQVVSFKQCMMGPMAAIGDSFFWASLRPFVAACAILGLLSGMVWAPVGFLLFYNALHLAVRFYGLWNGYSSGQEVCSRIHSLALVRLSLIHI